MSAEQVKSWAPAAVPFFYQLKNFHPKNEKLLCKPKLSVSYNLFLLSFTHTIFCSKPTETVEVEIPINPGSKCCNDRGVFILYEMRMNLKCYWNLPQLERGQDLDALVDTTQSFPLEIQGRGAGFQSKYDCFLSCR